MTNSTRKGERSWTSKRGEVRLWTPAGGPIVITLIGHGETSTLTEVPDLVGKALELVRSTSLFVDGELLESYETSFRVAMTDLVRKYLPRLDGVHGLTRSTLVTMGAAVVNLALSGAIKMHKTRGEFDAALAAAAQSNAARPAT